jgi:hypothetical protein
MFREFRVGHERCALTKPVIERVWSATGKSEDRPAGRRRDGLNWRKPSPAVLVIRIILGTRLVVKQLSVVIPRGL